MTALQRPDGGSAGSRLGCDSMPITTSWRYSGARSARGRGKGRVSASSTREAGGAPEKPRRTADDEHVGVEVDPAVLVQRFET